MDFNELSTFITLAELLSFRKSSEKHHISVSALSKSIQRLEQDLDCQLFIRTNRAVTLTEQGKLFYTFATQTMAQYEYMLQDLHPNQSTHIKGSITLYSTVTAASHILPRLLKKFRKKHPNITTYIETGEVKQGIDKLMDNDVDFAVGIISERILKQCLCQKILTTPLVYITPKKLPFSSISDIPMIMPDGGTLEDRIKDFLEPYSNIGVHSYVKGHEAILAMVAAGLGAAILPKIVVDNSHLNKQVRVIHSLTLPCIEVGLFARKNLRFSPAKEAFFEFSGKQFKRHTKA